MCLVCVCAPGEQEQRMKANRGKTWWKLVESGVGVGVMVWDFGEIITEMWETLFPSPRELRFTSFSAILLPNPLVLTLSVLSSLRPRPPLQILSLSISLSWTFPFFIFFLTPACCFTTLAPSLTSPHLGHVLRFLLYLYLHSLLLSTRLQAHQQGARKEPTPTNLNVRNLRGFKNSALDPKGPELNHHLFKSSSRRVKCRAKMRNTEAISFSVTADRWDHVQPRSVNPCPENFAK